MKEEKGIINEKIYIIYESDLRRLIEADLELEALNSGGVDNWGWYGESKSDFIQEYCSCNKQLIVDYFRSMNNHIGISDEEIYEEERDDVDFKTLANIEILAYEEYRNV